MAEEFKHLSEEERLKAENDFMKMKLMLEKGAEFGNMQAENKLPPDIENSFLNYIMAFEKQSENPVYIKVFDKIGRPEQFKPVAEIPATEIESEWLNLLNYLAKYHINFSVCSPNITFYELYRFVTEELFQHEMNDIDIPELTTNFIYDEFYPDPVYENTNAAIDDCMEYILQKEPMEWTHHFRNENLRLNNHHTLTIEEFKSIVNNSKSVFSEIKIEDISSKECKIENSDCCVEGIYTIRAIEAGAKILLSGNWKVFFELDDQLGYWYIYEVKIEGISL